MNIAKHIGIIATSCVVMMFSGCTENEQNAVNGAIAGAVVSEMVSSSQPKYYDRPYYYKNNRYYYGGRHHKGVYHYGTHRYTGGHYYANGYRYHNGNRYKAVPGRYGHYTSASHYNRYRKYRR